MNSSTIIAIITVTEIVITYICLWLAYDSRRPQAHHVRNSLRLIILILGLRVCMLFVHNAVAGYILYTIFAIAHIFYYIVLCAYLMDMSHQKVSLRAKRIYQILIAIDVVSFVVGFFTGHVLEYHAVNGTVTIFHNFGYYYHTFLKSILLVYIIYKSINKMRNTYYIYWQRYILFALCISLALALDIIRFDKFTALDYPGFVMFFAGLLIYFLTCVVRSKILRAHMLSEVFNQTPQFTFLVDNEKECVLVNESGREYFDIKEYDYSDVWWRILSLTEKSDYVFSIAGGTTIKYVKNDHVNYLKFDKKDIIHGGKSVGTIYGFTDISNGVKEFIERQRKSQFDLFSKVYNNEYLLERMDKLISENPDKEYYVIGSDIRDFKVFNDVFGKEAGDQIIIKTGEILRELFDEGYLDLYGRIYADRFGMMVEKERFSENAIINKFMAIDHPFNEEYYHLNIHFGVYPTGMEAGLPAKSMFDRAFVALDSIKNDVNIRLYHYNEIMRDEKIWEQTISSNIEKAIKEGQLRIVVQPQVDRNEKVVGGEALVRWRHPINGEISPGNFIPVLEKTGLVTNADVFVWEECCKLLRRWKDLGHTEYYVSVNISPTDFIFADIYSIFTGLVKKYEIDPKNLKLEITETAMMTDVLERIVLIKRLEEFGFSVELDDFGSGYSSLNMLKEIPVDVIKMDMKFLYNYDDNSTSNSRKVIGHIIQMAKDLDMEIVAEGVETKEQLGFLKDSGCDVFQGYYFSKPVEVPDFESSQGIA